MLPAPIRIGVGGWTFEPWRDHFYPPKWPHARELEYAASKLTAIEVNGTYYSGFKPETFAKWRNATPPGFVFTLKASRYCTNRKVLADAGESIARFVGQGIVELGDRLGPILWQFMATKRFDPDDFAAFLALLPRDHAGIALRHAIHVRHDSFQCAAFVDLCRAAGVAIVFADSPAHPPLADVTANFVYARLEAGDDANPHCYPDAELPRWEAAAHTWAAGGQPDGLPLFGPASVPVQPRETFMFFISGGKVNAPAGAQRLIALVSPD